MINRSAYTVYREWMDCVSRGIGFASDHGTFHSESSENHRRKEQLKAELIPLLTGQVTIEADGINQQELYRRWDEFSTLSEAYGGWIVVSDDLKITNGIYYGSFTIAPPPKP